jgi:hypothetical protein
MPGLVPGIPVLAVLQEEKTCGSDAVLKDGFALT